MGGGAGLHSRSWAAEARARATGRGDARGRLLRLTCAQYVVHMYDSEVLYRGLYRSYRICVNKIFIRLRERLRQP